MQSGNQESIFDNITRRLLIIFVVFIFCTLFIFKNVLLKPNLLLKTFGESSINPELAFKNNKPTFLEFYAEWCEVCKEMAPTVSELKDEYEEDVNFVFLNVDNPKWENYIQKFKVNGIPQVNLFDNKGILETTFIGKQDEELIRKFLENLITGHILSEKIINTDYSIIKDNNNYQSSPRSHG